MASEALFQALAEALSKPSKNYQALQTAFQIPDAGIKGYREGAGLADEIRKRDLQRQTLSQVLGGRVIPGLESFKDTPVEAANAIEPFAKFKDKPSPFDGLVPVVTQDEALKQGHINPKAKIINTSPNDRNNRQEVQNLRQQYLRESKEFSDISNRISNVFAGAKDPSAAGDLSLIFSYMKMLDPTSVVREGEFATAANSGSVPDRLTAQYNKILNGERLAPQMRADFVKRSEDIYKAQQINQKQRANEFSRIAAQRGVDPRDVVVDMTIPVPAEFSGISSGEDAAAIAWLEANPNAPEANAVRAKLKSKGVQGGL